MLQAQKAGLAFQTFLDSTVFQQGGGLYGVAAFFGLQQEADALGRGEVVVVAS